MDDGSPIGVSLTGVREPDGSADARRLIGWVKGLGVRWIQLDATAAGTRPRELERSARRDLASAIRRADLMLAGIDLYIPPAHYTMLANQDRAVSALTGTIELAGELGQLLGQTPCIVAVDFPSDLGTDVAQQIENAAGRAGVLIADHHRPPRAGSGAAIGIGIDPALLIAAGEDLFDTVTRMREPVVQARLSDTAGGARVVPGSGDGSVDLVEYLSALGVMRYARPVIADMRGLREPFAAAPRVLQAWRRAGGVGMPG